MCQFEALGVSLQHGSKLWGHARGGAWRRKSQRREARSRWLQGRLCDGRIGHRTAGRRGRGTSRLRNLESFGTLVDCFDGIVTRS